MKFIERSTVIHKISTLMFTALLLIWTFVFFLVLVRYESKAIVNNGILLCFLFYVGSSGYYSGDEFHLGNFIGAVMMSTLTFMFMIPFQVAEAIGITLGLLEPSHWPNIILNGPKAHFSR
jgi:hypothetical protein